ncbi:MAG TPA: AbrB/MazE/SpoVT family DNA-binding domain-containing protein [Candidatus Baltobacteraceae bacterium]|nr:AbrB/MazE/SpoVT family DNA-binding domain-containing protein [Candidatus Baltobacteraceae bacterium]
MRTRVDRWGNSLGVRLPKSVAERIGLREGDPVEMEIDGNAVIVRRAGPRYTLDQLLENLAPETRHEDYFADSGFVGRERFLEGEEHA